MSIFDDIKRGFQHAPHQVEDAFHHAVDGIQHAAKEGEHAVEGAVHKAQADLHKTAGDLSSHLKDAVNKGKDELQKQLESKQGEFVSNVVRVGKEVETKVKGLGDAVEENAEEIIKKVIKHIGESFSSAAAKKAFKALLNIAEKNPVSEVGGSISVVSYAVSDLGEKVTKIKKYVEAPPHGHEEVIAALQDIGIGQVTITVSGQVFTSAISFSVWATVDIADAVAFIDTLADTIKDAIVD